MPPGLTLYGFPGSLCSQKVRLALAEKGAAYQNRLVDIELRLQNYEPWYLRLNPRGVVPTLVHGDHVSGSSSAASPCRFGCGSWAGYGTTRHLASDTYSVADVAWTCVLADGRTPPS
jgi:glutathione S-transferase